MKIRPKNEILFAYKGVKFSQNNLRGANWRQQVFDNYRLHLLDLLAKYGEVNDYGEWLNEMLSRHSNIYNLAGGENGNWENIAYENNLVGLYQLDYRGGLGNDNQYKRYGTIQLNPEDNYDFNLSGIKTNLNTRYNITDPTSRTSGDFFRNNHNYRVDNLYSAITDDRRLLGREGDWDEQSLNEWNSLLKNSGWEMYLDNDKYYKLRRLSQDTPLNGRVLPEVVVTPEKKKTQIPVDGNKTYGFDWNKLKEAGQKIFGNPDLYATGRLVGNLINNNRVYDELLKGIKPTLRQTYNTYRQVLGDEATKQAYYRRAVLGETKAARPFTSDADRLMAYLFEAKRVGDELRSQGDLADNQEIRRTSDESNQHLWNNIQRATEVANANTASIDQANAEKHKLLAQKHSAQWSSIDNFLQGIEYRKRQLLEELKALDDKIYALTRANEIENDSELLDLLAQLETASKKPENQKESYGLKVINYDSKEIKDIVNKINQRKTQLQIETYLNLYNRKRNNNLWFFKSGSKITHKKKDDLLYKSTKDVVEHFRKMSKMSLDALNRKLPKIEKLTSHPKGKTKKYQLGGVAPFTIYKPVALGGETTTTTSSLNTSSDTNKSSSGKETLDLVKSLFKELLGKGLPVDVNIIYSQMNDLFTKQKLFGTELDTNDLALMYLQSMLSLSNAMYSKEKYDKAEALATLNEALDEFAVNALGHFIVLDTNTGKLSTEKSWEDVLTSGKNPITNSLLLLMRAYNPDLAFYKGDNIIGNVIGSGMGINKIAAQIKTLAGDIGSYEGKIEGLTQVESNKVKQGLQLLANAPDGYYKHTVEDKNQLTQIKAAIAYITNMLSPSQRAILDTHGGADKLIPLFLASQENVTHNVSFLPLTEKAASKDSDGSKGGLEMNNALKLLTGGGEGHLETFGIGNNNVFLAVGRQSIIADTSESEKPFGADFSYNKIYESSVGRILDLDNASFGDVPINKAMKDSIIVENSRIVSVDLPYTTTRDGRIIPDFKLLNRILEADKEILRQNLNPNKESDINKINQIYADKKLPIKYNSTNQLSRNYMKFAVILATAVEDAFLNKDGLETNATLTLVTDDNEKNKYVRLMSEITKDKKYSLNKPGIFNWGDKDIYKGSIFIPITGDIIDASLAGGSSKVKTGMSDDYDTMRKAWQVRNYLKVPQVNFSN